jgi:hypothetical protein
MCVMYQVRSAETVASRHTNHTQGLIDAQSLILKLRDAVNSDIRLIARANERLYYATAAIGNNEEVVRYTIVIQVSNRINRWMLDEAQLYTLTFEISITLSL